MTDKEYRKIIADARRSVSREYGFRQSSYINFKVDDGKRNMNVGKTRLQSTAVYGRTIFWKETK